MAGFTNAEYEARIQNLLESNNLLVEQARYADRKCQAMKRRLDRITEKLQEIIDSHD